MGEPLSEAPVPSPAERLERAIADLESAAARKDVAALEAATVVLRDLTAERPAITDKAEAEALGLRLRRLETELLGRISPPAESQPPVYSALSLRRTDR